MRVLCGPLVRQTGAMRRRIVALAVAAAVLAISLFGLPLAVGVAKYNANDERSELERIATRAALTITDDLSASVAPPAPSDDQEVQVGVYSPAGQLISGRGPATSDDAVQQAAGGDVAVSDAGADIAVAVPVESGGTLTGVVRASTPRSEITLKTALVWLLMAGFALLAGLLTWAIARRMGARLARPLEDLADAAQVLGDGDFTVRTTRSGIAEIDSVGSALDSTAQRIGATLQRERAFTANASHQLRTPLAGMRLQLEAALESGVDPHQAMRTAVESIDRLERTVKDLMALTRDTDRPQARVLDLEDVFSDARRTWHDQLTTQGRTLRTNTRGAPQPRAAEAAIRQVLNVLLDNAFTHGTGTVTVTARDAGGPLAVDVADEGHGLEPDTDPFSGDRRDGHGIGLPLARSLTEAEGGRLILTSTTPTTFTFLLPAANEPE